MNQYLKYTSCVHKTSPCQNIQFITAAGLICHLQIVLLMMTKAAGRATCALTIQSQPLCIHRSWTSLTPSVFSPSHIWMWVSASGRFFSLPWGMAHPEGPIRRERTERDREQRGTLSSLATINNLADATSRVCSVTLCSCLAPAPRFCCWVNIYRFVLCAALSSPTAKCQSGECTVFEKFLFAMFWCLNEKELQLTASIFSAIHGKWIWNQMEHKNKLRRYTQTFGCILQTAAPALLAEFSIFMH